MIDRYFIPGSEWLFLKIYTGSKSADTILSEDIRILTKYLLEQTYIDSFFFIRYADPNFHIRLRLHIPKPEIGYSPIMCTIHNAFRPLMAKGLIFSVVCDTYMRELERYGEQTISSVERFFFQDSFYELVLIHLLNQNSHANTEQLRWRMSIRLVGDMCESFFPELVDRKDLIGKLAESYRKEFNFTRAVFTGQLNDLYRTNRKQIADTLDSTEWMPNGAQLIFTQRKESLSTQISIIQKINKQTANSLDEFRLFESLIHMTMNRWFRSRNRLHEMVIYNFMSKYYDSKYARYRYNK